jgi:hypothetical protein
VRDGKFEFQVLGVERSPSKEGMFRYRLRLVGYPGLIGAQGAVEWNGKRYAVDRDPRVYNSSRRTAHIDYVIVRR